MKTETTKAILVINMPNSCDECPFSWEINEEWKLSCQLEHDLRTSKGKKPDWCPLKSMPTKKKPLFDPDHCDIEEEIKIIHEIDGYNRCIDEIMGEIE